MPDAYTITCLHEASHAVAAMAMGVSVTKLAVDTVGNATAGECFLTLPADTVHAVAILLAGVNGTNAFSHLLGNMPDVEPKQRRVESTHGQSCIHPPESSRVSIGTWSAPPEALGAGRDGGMIARILSALPDASQIFNHADMLSRRILAENHRVLMTLARRLAERGELNASDFQDVSQATIPAFAGTI